MSNRFFYKFPKFSLLLRKRLITLPLFLLSIMVFGKNYYIKNGGNDLLTGTSDSDAWESISKVNSFSFSPGDSILFKRGDKFIGTITPSSSGTSGSYITFGAYGTGDDPVITPNAVVTGLTWTVHSGSIYKTTGIGYNPGNILIDGTTKINKINDYYMTHTPSDGFYGNFTPLQLLALAEDYTFSINSLDVKFWDGLDALYCYDAATTTTYIRFRAGDNPNSKSLAIAADNANAVYVNGVNYIIIQNLRIVGGENGIKISGSGANNIIIENNIIESSNVKVCTVNASNTIIIHDNDFTNNYLSSYVPGSWINGTTYTEAVCRHYYEFGKHRIDTSDSTNIDCAIKMANQTNYTITYNNAIKNCIDGIFINGLDTKTYDNNIQGTSSIGIYFDRATQGSEAYDNYLVDCNIGFRFGWVDDLSFPDRTNYVYRNKYYSPNAGEFIHIHYGSEGASVIEAFLYHNSVICKTGIVCSSVAGNYPAVGTGFTFVNNIISVSGDNSYGYPNMATHTGLFIFYYNWVGGTYYGAGSLIGDISVWATDASNLNNVGKTFWNHSVVPPDFINISGTEVIDAGIDVSKTFTLGGVNYSALPGISPDDYNDDAPDLGAWEYNSGYPSIAITSPTIGSTFTAPAAITITVNASDADGTVSKVEFFSGATKLGEKTSNPWSFTWNNVPVGTYSLTAVATDNSGAKKTSSAVSITVAASTPPVTNNPPIITISNPVTGSTFTAPASITITANASDSDGTISKVEFFNGTVKLGEKTSNPWSSTWNNVQVGIYSLTAVATDNSNAKTTSSVVTITVNNLPPIINQAPVITISNPTKGKKYKKPAKITIDAVASDPDGTISKVEFFSGNSKGNIKLAELTTPPWSFTWNVIDTGTYRITAIATDNLNATTVSSPVDVEVEEDITTSFYDADSEILKLYPNPNNGIFTIELTDPLQSERSEITIASYEGRVINNDTMLQDELTRQFDLSYIKPGFYILILARNEIIVTKKFIKE